jgi:hypothetical protein
MVLAITSTELLSLITFTLATQVDTLLLLSVTVKVTLFGLVAMSEQEKDVLLKAIDLIPHASDEPLLICAAESVPLPELVRTTVAFLQMDFGAVLSTTVTLATQVDTVLLLLVTVKVTLLGLEVMSLQEKDVLLRAIDFIPWTSDEPLST